MSMQFLIDTHILIWYLDGSNKLPEKIKNIINDENNIIVVSIASIWELAIKISLKKIDTKLDLPDVETHITERQFKLLNISFKHLNALTALLTHHGDPFDRLLIAQAITEDLTILSADKQFKAYSVRVIW